MAAFRGTFRGMPGVIRRRTTGPTGSSASPQRREPPGNCSIRHGHLVEPSVDLVGLWRAPDGSVGGVGRRRRWLTAIFELREQLRDPDLGRPPALYRPPDVASLASQRVNTPRRTSGEGLRLMAIPSHATSLGRPRPPAGKTTRSIRSRSTFALLGTTPPTARPARRDSHRQVVYATTSSLRGAEPWPAPDGSDQGLVDPQPE